MTEIKSEVNDRLDALEQENVRLAGRCERLEAAAVSLNEGITCFKPLPLNRHPALKEIVTNTGGGMESRPYILPEHRQVVGRVA